MVNCRHMLPLLQFNEVSTLPVRDECVLCSRVWECRRCDCCDVNELHGFNATMYEGNGDDLYFNSESLEADTVATRDPVNPPKLISAVLSSPVQLSSACHLFGVAEIENLMIRLSRVVVELSSLYLFSPSRLMLREKCTAWST